VQCGIADAGRKPDNLLRNMTPFCTAGDNFCDSGRRPADL